MNMKRALNIAFGGNEASRCATAADLREAAKKLRETRSISHAPVYAKRANLLEEMARTRA